jgi:CspA family cold shock protein
VHETVSSTGTVKWFNEIQGFGIIVDDRSGAEVFVHHSAISEPGSRSLHEGQHVRFEAFEGARGYQAAVVRNLL